MGRSHTGFTVIELVIALLIGSILTSVALTSYGNARGRFAVRGAQNMFTSLHARARAQAIERGATVRLIVDVPGDSVYLWSGGTNLETVHFADDLHVDVRSSVGNIVLCMNTRGYADPDCNNFTGTARVAFVQNADSVSVLLLPLGQLVF
jgi:prepilin-type N-terminal cleavage/methylation domain-containing protein